MPEAPFTGHVDDSYVPARRVQQHVSNAVQPLSSQTPRLHHFTPFAQEVYSVAQAYRSLECIGTTTSRPTRHLWDQVRTFAIIP